VRTTRSGRLKRRSADDIATALDKIVALVKTKKEGLRAEQIRKTLKMQPKEMPRVLQEGLAKKKLKSKGQKRRRHISERSTQRVGRVGTLRRHNAAHVVAMLVAAIG